jgi:hypothetical protein
MKINKFENLYPADLYVIRVNNVDELVKAISKFYILQPNLNDLEDNQGAALKDAYLEGSSGCCCAAVDKATDSNCILCFMFEKNVSTKTIAHESVHIADYYCQLCDIYTQDFCDGNEAYAYLVGWAADCIDKTVKDGKRKTKQRGVIGTVDD